MSGLTGGGAVIHCNSGVYLGDRLLEGDKVVLQHTVLVKVVLPYQTHQRLHKNPYA